MFRTTLFLSLLVVQPVWGQDRTTEERLDRLAATQQTLDGEIRQLKQRLLEARVLRKVAAEEESRVQLDLDWGNGFQMRSADNAFHMQVGGRLHVDARVQLDEDDPERGEGRDTFRVRRAWIRTNGHLHRWYYWRVVAALGDRSMLLDAWVDVRYWDALRLKVGQYLAPFGQERLTSDKFVKPVDRSMASTFIAPWYEVGIQLHGRLFLNRLSYAVMLANGNGISLSDENDDKELVARVFLRPWVNTTNPWLRGLQVGGAVTYGQQATASVAGMGPKTTPGTLVYSYADGTRRDGDRYRWSLQAAWHVGPFTLRGELMQMDERVKRTGAAVDVTHTGWYATAAYLLTGERQSFGRVTPRDPFDPHDPKGGWGAWELAARVGQIQYDKGDRMLILGGHGATQWIGGLNWYPNAAVRVSLQYQHASFRESIGGTDSEDTMFLRLQIEF